MQNKKVFLFSFANRRLYSTKCQKCNDQKLIEKTDLDWHHAAPGGDVMMTGTVGLIKTMMEKIKC